MLRFTVIALLFITATTAHPQQPALPMIYTGDGMTIRVTAMSEETGKISGEIMFNGKTYPFTGTHVEDASGELVRGTFQADNHSFEFTSRNVPNSEEITFTSGEKTYRLAPSKHAPAPAPTNPIDRGDNAPVAPNANPNAPAPANVPGTLRLKIHPIPDDTMGVPVSHTVLLPADWNVQGRIEWQPVGEALFPQQMIEITSPQHGRIRFVPQMTFSYINSPGISEQGTPAPQDFPQWIVQFLSQNNRNVSNVRLVDAKRDTKTEQALDAAHRAAGGMEGSNREIHLITIEYDEANIHRREELNLSYVRFPPFNGINGFSSQTWAIWTSAIVSAPADQFAAQKPQLYTVAGSITPTPQWYTHSQALIAEMSRKRLADKAGEIRARGKRLTEISDADHEKWKRDMNKDDPQRTRIQSIYETHDYKDSDGATVELPIHYHHVFSDGKGNYILSNDSSAKPGELWTEIKPIK